MHRQTQTMVGKGKKLNMNIQTVCTRIIWAKRGSFRFLFLMSSRAWVWRQHSSEARSWNSIPAAPSNWKHKSSGYRAERIKPFSPKTERSGAHPGHHDISNVLNDGSLSALLHVLAQTRCEEGTQKQLQKKNKTIEKSKWNVTLYTSKDWDSYLTLI